MSSILRGCIHDNCVLLSFMVLREVFALNLRRFRLEKGLSQEELAFRAELDRTYISSLERSVYAATIDAIERIAKALEVMPFRLLSPPERGKRLTRISSRRTG
jgi:transcriptional regulator with XRE-family HTH domain